MAIIFVLNFMVVATACADTIEKSAVISEVMDRLGASQLDETILEAAKTLFWSLAAISLVWTMGALIVRQDIGELLMELLRFVIATGFFYWLLVNASSREGGEDFVGDIVSSFLQMASGVLSDETVRGHGDGVMSKGLIAYFDVLLNTGDGENADRVLSGIIATAILCVCSVMAAQFLLALVMAWILGYAGIFLLGFGGARWTSSIAINYYKHVVAVGAALLVLSMAGAITGTLLDDVGQEGMSRNYAAFASLGMMLGISILMMVVSIKVPQMIYTLVTGSVVGLYAGSANAAGTAIAAGGSSAYAAAMGRFPGGGGGSGGDAPGGPAGSGASRRAESVMDAVHRSASIAGGMADPFHVNSGADPFGAARAPDVRRGGTRHGSVFGPMPTDAWSTASGPSSFGAAEEESSTPDSSSIESRPVPKHGPAYGAKKASSVDMSGKQRSSASISSFTEVGETASNEYLTSTKTAASPMPAASGAGHHGEEGALLVEQPIDTAPRTEERMGSNMQHGSDDRARVPSIPRSIDINESGLASEANHDSEHTKTTEVLRDRNDPSSAPPATVHVGRGETTGTASAASEHEATWQGGANAPLSSADVPTSQIASTEHSRDLPTATLGHEDMRVAPVSEEVHGGVPDTFVETSGHATRSAASTTQERHPVAPTAAAVQPEATPPIGSDLGVRGDSDAPSSRVREGGAAEPMQSAKAPGMSQSSSMGHTPVTDVAGISTSTSAPDSPPATVTADGAAPLRRDAHAPIDDPTTSIVQEDMKTAPPSAEVQVVMPAAVVETAAPVQNETVSDAAASGAHAPGQRKHRVLRRPDEAPPVLPPVDRYEPPEDDQP